MVSTSFEQRLAAEYATRKAMNPRFSIRAFARALKADAGSIAQILRGVRRASSRQIATWCDRLNIPASERSVYASLAKRDPIQVVRAAERLHQWAEDMVSLTRNPAHIGLLAEAREAGGATSFAQIAQRSGCSIDDVQMAISRLLRLGWLDMPECGRRRDLTGLPSITKRSFADFVHGKSESLKREFGIYEGKRP